MSIYDDDRVPKYSSRRKFIWVGQSFRPADGVPDRLPGMVSTKLPDDWVIMIWADKVGWHSPHAVYETKNLLEVSDEVFEQRVREVRASSWPGFPPEPEPEPFPSRFTVGDPVRWPGPPVHHLGWDGGAEQWIRDALGGGLEVDHPGTIVEVSPNAAVRVRWVDKAGEFEARDFIHPDFVEPVSAEEAAFLTERLRSSAWPGLVNTRQG